MRLILDIEGNNHFEEITKVHCLVAKDIDTGKVRRFRAHSKGAESLEAGLRYVEKAELVIGHNVLGFDLDALKKVYPSFNYRGEVLDTIVLSALVFSNLMELDSTQARIPKNLFGKHSLEAWGHRLGVHKGTFGKTEKDDEDDTVAVWAQWSPEMEDYCAQDVEVTHKLYRVLDSKKYSETAIRLEHEFKRIIVQQERHGWRFDVAAAEKLTAKLQAHRHEVTEELQAVFPPIKETLKTPAYYAAGKRQYPTIKAALEAGEKRAVLKPGPLRVKLHPFNPGSRQQIAARLIERYNWKPKKYTEPSKNFPNGQIQIDEGVLAGLPWPEAALLNKYLLIDKTLGQLAEGQGACLKLQKGGRIYGRVQTNGAVTGRCTHSKPNIAQTPAVMVDKTGPVLGIDGGFGWEFRSLYLPDPGHVLVGWDASGLELRCLAHFLFDYDGGRFGKLVTEGDPHTANQQAAGLYLRNSAKTFIYAFLYGAGDEKLGKIKRQDAIDAGKPMPKGTLKVLGATTRDEFLSNFSALGRLKEAIKATLNNRTWLTGLDGRRLHVRSSHAALNTLLQSAGALLMKKACVLQHEALQQKHHLVLHRDYSQVASVHDEKQFSVARKYAELVGRTGPEALKRAGEFFEFCCRLDGEFKIGENWAKTH